ncbi:MAG: hypothetical protein MOGMAGMI_02598 [Candidatus Omnitrophica bacterium]|nr:hypothetical protein [Candidatus Omnitrophota bacterium]
MQTVQTDLTILGAHTPTPAIYWKGQQVTNVSGLKVLDGKVTITVPEDPLLAEMQAAGIIVRRV